MHKLDPIERLPDGSLFRLTPGQLRSVRGLAKRCCNFLMATACCWTASARNTSPEVCFAGGFAAPYCPSSPSWNRPFSARKAPPLRNLRQGHPRPLRQNKIPPRLRQGGSPPAEGEIRPQTAVKGRQFRVKKSLNYKPCRTAKAARQGVFPRGRKIEFPFVYISTGTHA